MLKIAWKSFGNCYTPCFEVVENLSRPSVIVRSRREIFGSCWKPSAPEDVGKSSEIQILCR